LSATLIVLFLKLCSTVVYLSYNWLIVWLVQWYFQVVLEACKGDESYLSFLYLVKVFGVGDDGMACSL
jgi:hypothetical protein